MDVNNYAEAIKTCVTMRDVCNRYGVETNSSDFIHCIFHGEKTASCKLYRQGYHCYGCGAHGDVFDFVGKLFDLDFKGAEQKLNDDFGLGFPINEKITAEQMREIDRVAQIKRLERERVAKQRETLLTNYLDAVGYWNWIDKLKRKNKPTGPDNMNFLYCYACDRIETAKFRVQMAEADLYEFDENQKNKKALDI